MRYIKNLESFSKPIYYTDNKVKPEVDEHTIRAEGIGWYIDFYFDSEHRLDYVANPWSIKIPEWYGFNITETNIKLWAREWGYKPKVYKIIEHEAEKYNM